ncbi:MAG: hypothetical protein IJ124_01790 [Clostridia bacterium]|nr:hypothetical protein [Clostridia bacterium]
MRSSVTGTKNKKTNAARVEAGLEVLFLFLCAVYLVYGFSSMTTFYFPWPALFQRFLLLAMAVTALGRLAFIGPKRLEPWIALAAAAAYYLVYRSTDYSFLPFLAVMTAGMAGIDYRRALRAYLAAVGGMLVLTVAAALSGSIENFVYFRDGLKSSWGISYPTDLASACLYVLMMLWLIWRRAPGWVMLPVSLTSVLMALFVARSRNSLVCGALFVCAVAWLWLARGRKDGKRGFPGRAFDGLLTAAFPLFAAITFLMVFLYARQTGFGDWLNNMLSDRLRLCLDGWWDYGLTPFGTAFDQIGYGFSAFPPDGYNFIDSSYMLILLRYGWVTLLGCSAAWVWMTRRALQRGDRRLAIVLGIIAFHSIVEHHFMEVHFNILLVMPLAAIAGNDAEEARARTKRPRGVVIGAAAYAALMALAVWFGLPVLLTRLRTVFQALGWQGGGQYALPVAAVLLGVICALAGTVWALWRLLRRALMKERFKLLVACALAGCIALNAGFWVWTDGVVRKAAVDNADMIEANVPGLECVLSAATGEVYADVLPEAFARRVPGIRPTVLAGEDMSRLRGTTTLLDAWKEHHVFFQNGFKYAQISPTHAVYTDDAPVAEALAAAGYAVTDYYSSQLQMDLVRQAELNELPLDGRGLLLDGTAHSMIYGPYVDVYGGQYRVVYSLSLAEDDAGDADETVCRLRVCSYWGQNLLAELSVTRGQFDAWGNLTAVIPFVTGTERGMGFQAIAAEGCRLYVRDVSYYKFGG